MRSCSALSRTSLDQREDLAVLPAAMPDPARARDQVDVGAGDDQFADQVDQLVELVGVDADESAFLRAASAPQLLLPIERGLDTVRAAPPPCDQDAPSGAGVGLRLLPAVAAPAAARRRVSVPQRTSISPSRAGSGSGASARGSRTTRLCGGRMRSVQSSRTNSNTFPASPCRRRSAGDLVAQVAGSGSKPASSGSASSSVTMPRSAQGLQVADEVQRVHAVAQHLGAEAQRQVPGVGERGAFGRCTARPRALAWRPRRAGLRAAAGSICARAGPAQRSRSAR
jgi:hypothetical protein